MKEEIKATSDAVVEAQSVEELTSLVDDLLQVTEELRLENQIIRDNLTNCCASTDLRASANDAYLLQNAPNPFNELAEIRYFIPEGLENVTINVCDIKGAVLKSSNNGFIVKK